MKDENISSLQRKQRLPLSRLSYMSRARGVISYFFAAIVLICNCSLFAGRFSIFSLAIKPTYDADKVKINASRLGILRPRITFATRAAVYESTKHSR